ncbi:MAG: glutamate--tRNA ligase family protein [Verrucomicrobiota bacterium]
MNPFDISDYFEHVYEYILQLVTKAKAYSPDLSPDHIDKYRQAPDRPGLGPLPLN